MRGKYSRASINIGIGTPGRIRDLPMESVCAAYPLGAALEGTCSMGLFRVISKVLLIKSFLLGAAVLWLWVRSYSVADRIAVEVGAKSSSLTIANGLVIYKAEA